MSSSHTNKTGPRPIQNYVFAAILILLFLAVCRLFAPFFTVLLWSILLYILFSPLHRRLIRNISFSNLQGKIIRNVWAVIFTLGTFLIILVPFSFAFSVFFQQIAELVRLVRDTFNERPEILGELLNRLSDFIREVTGGYVIISADEISQQIQNFLAGGLQGAVTLGGNLVRNAGGFAMNILLMAFSTYFFYIDGPYLSRLVLSAIPIRKEYVSALTTKFMDIIRNLFFGYIIVAAIQATIAYIIFMIFGVKGSLVLAALTFLVVFIPMAGAAIIWIPLGVIRIASGDTAGGIIFMIVSAVFISGADNIIRPFFLRDRIQLHPLIIFFAILGGLAVFGFNGMILGPVLVILFLTVLDMFLLEHKIGGRDQAEPPSEKVSH